MDINTFLNERAIFNNFLFSMSFPDIVNYLERNPREMSKVEWDLFTNSKIRSSKNIDSYPELILKHSNWPWRFNINQIQNELSRKISELNRLSKPSKVVSLSSSNKKVESENWIDKIINSMEKLCEMQNKLKTQQNKVIKEEVTKEIKEEVKEMKEEMLLKNVMMQIVNEEMPPDDFEDIPSDGVEKFFHEESDNESGIFEDEDPSDI